MTALAHDFVRKDGEIADEDRDSLHTLAIVMLPIQTSIFPENEASLALHARVGFRVVGRRERLAQLDGEWRDVLFLERRAP